MRELARMVAADPDAKAGLQRAVADYMAQRVIRSPKRRRRHRQPKAFGDFVWHNAALREVFSPEQMQEFNNIAADLQRPSRALPKGNAPAVTVGVAGKLSVLSQYLGPGRAVGRNSRWRACAIAGVTAWAKALQNPELEHS